MTFPAASSQAWRVRGYSKAVDFDPAVRPTFKLWRHLRAQIKDGHGSMCARWRNPEHFIADVGLRPEGEYLKLIDRQKAWMPGNVRWEKKA